MSGEYKSLTDEIWTNFYFYLIIFISGLLGFIVGFATYAQIAVTSSLTHNISGSVKACIQVLICYII